MLSFAMLFPLNYTTIFFFHFPSLAFGDFVFTLLYVIQSSSIHKLLSAFPLSIRLPSLPRIYIYIYLSNGNSDSHSCICLQTALEELKDDVLNAYVPKVKGIVVNEGREFVQV